MESRVAISQLVDDVANGEIVLQGRDSVAGIGEFEGEEMTVEEILISGRPMKLKGDKSNNIS